jgi:hypothetical protein
MPMKAQSGGDSIILPILNRSAKWEWAFNVTP